MLKLTRRADYGLISLKHLAVCNRSASAKEISDAYGLPLPLLSKVLQRLARTGFLQSEHGTNGGYRLRRKPSEISALEVIRTIDGPIFLTSCFTGADDCGVASRCNVREPLRKVHEGIQRLLAGISIADMCDDDEAVTSCSQEEPEGIFKIGPARPAV
jgi:Rrf2 family protein